MKLKIIRRAFGQAQEKTCVDYVCMDEDGEVHNVDLFVDGGIPSEIAEKLTDADLIGKTIEIENLHPFLEIANGVKWPPIA